VVLTNTKVEPLVKDLAAGVRFQFERLGYFCVDAKSSLPGAPVLNRTVTLKDTWAKVQAKG
jgi:glutaminyl-tRNA synthetase